MAKKRTLVIGASENPDRYSNRAMRMLQGIDEKAIGIGRKEGRAHDTDIVKGLPVLDDIDIVTLYIGPRHQDEYIDYVIDKIKPRRIIFNPGTENSDFVAQAEKKGIETIEACTLVMIRTGQY